MHAKLTRNLLLIAGTLSAVAVGYGIARVHAEGAPTMQPLWYSGTVADDMGMPLDGNYDVELRLFSKETGLEPAICEVLPTKTLPFENGRFRVDVSECADEMQAQSDLYVELTVDPSPNDKEPGKAFARSKIGAVPYALEAQHALSASNGAASGAVMAFDLDNCPAGWTELVAARGRTIVGVNPGAASGLSARSRGAVYGAESVTLGAANLPAHAHSGTTAQGTEATPGATNAWRDYNTLGCGQTGRGYQYINDQNCFGASVLEHYHTFTTDGGPGTSQPVNLEQPSLVLLYCRRT